MQAATAMTNQTKINKMLRKCYDLKSNIRSSNMTIESMQSKLIHLKKRHSSMTDKLDGLIDDLKEMKP